MYSQKNKPLNTQSAQLHKLFISVVVLTACAAWLLARYHSLLPIKSLIDPTVLIFSIQKLIRPEPVERFVFLTLALAVPLSTFCAALMVFRKTEKTLGTPRMWMTAWVVLGAVFFYLPFAGFHTGLAKDSLGGPSRFLAYQYLALAGLAAALGLAGFWYLSRSNRLQKHNNNAHTSLHQRDLFSAISTAAYRRMSWVIFVLLMLLQISTWRLLSEASLTRGAAWFDSFDAVIYSVSQVVAGKTFLADLPSQYGFFALFMNPVFKVAGLSIFTFTALCAVLQIFSLTAIYAVVQRIVRDKALLMFYTLSLLTVTFGTVVWFIGLDDQGFQYWPIRFLWPAFSVFLFYRYACRPKLLNAFFISLAGALGSIWNAETGLVIVVAFAGVLTAKWALLYTLKLIDTKAERQNLLRALGLHVLTFAMCVLLTLSWFAMNADGPLRLDWLYVYQKTFYGLGFGMLPMPTHLFPWMSVLSIYLMGLIVAVQLWVFNSRSKTAALLLYLALLGLGLFVYYQGRSHPLNLISVSWPALTLLVILSDRVVRAVKANLLSKVHLVYPAAGLSVLLVFSTVLLIAIPRMFAESADAFVSRNKYDDALVRSELDFIRQHSKAGDACAILSLRQGSYYAATGLVSPMSGPGYVEMLLQSDRESFLDQLKRRKMSCLFIGLGKDSALDLGVDVVKFLPEYGVSARNATGSMLLLLPKK